MRQRFIWLNTENLMIIHAVEKLNGYTDDVSVEGLPPRMLNIHFTRVNILAYLYTGYIWVLVIAARKIKCDSPAQVKRCMVGLEGTGE